MVLGFLNSNKLKHKARSNHSNNNNHQHQRHSNNNNNHSHSDPLLNYRFISQDTSSTGSMSSFIYAQTAHKILSLEEINRELEKNQRIQVFNNRSEKHAIIKCVHVNMYAANDPIEDRFDVQVGEEESFFAVYDGHAGDGCAEFLKTHLIPYIKFRLYMRQSTRNHLKNKTRSSNESSFEEMLSMSDEDWERAIQNASQEKEKNLLRDMRNMVSYQHGIPRVLKESFIYTDSVFCKGALVRMIKNKQVHPDDLSGSCALVVYMQKNQLWIANTGDCRALIANRNPVTKQLKPIPLSFDQTAETEEQRLKQEFPHEKDIVLDGRIKGGLQPSRSFGDITYKESIISLLLPDLIKNQEVWNPPYVKAEPEVIHYEMDTRYDEFMVIATDGLWDVLSNEEVVSLVNQFIRNSKRCSNSSEVIEKDNVATFLVKQALLKSGFGNNEQEKLSNLIQLPTELKRMVHDDITVIVVFFNKSLYGQELTQAARTATDTSNSNQQFQEVDDREEVKISPIYVQVLKDFSSLISEEK
jgi:pyruvate dehydrogenase phosphatase